MPQRTNDFQELVSLVQTALVPAGAKVTDSALVDVPGMDQPREIDVLIESGGGTYRIKIAVEAKKHRRKLEMTQFESLLGKYLVEGGVKVDKVVVVTHSGFSKPVITRAKLLGVDLLTLKEAKGVDWGKFRPFPMPFKTAARICDIEVVPPVSGARAADIVRDGRVFCSHGTDFGSLQQFAAMHFLKNALPKNEQLVREADEIAAREPDGKKAKVEVMFDHPHMIRFANEELPISKLSFAVHFSKANRPVVPPQSELRFQFAPHLCRIDFEPPIKGCTSKVLAAEGHLICKLSELDHGTLNEWANKLIFEQLLPHNPEIVKRFHQELIQSPVGQAWLTVPFPLDENHVIQFRGKSHSVSSLNIVVHAVSAKAPIVCTHYELMGLDGDAKMITRLQATAGGKTFNIVIPHVEGGHPEKIVLKVGDAPPPNLSGVNTPTTSPPQDDAQCV